MIFWAVLAIELLIPPFVSFGIFEYSRRATSQGGSSGFVLNHPKRTLFWVSIGLYLILSLWLQAMHNGLPPLYKMQGLGLGLVGYYVIYLPIVATLSLSLSLYSLHKHLGALSGNKDHNVAPGDKRKTLKAFWILAAVCILGYLFLNIFISVV